MNITHVLQTYDAMFGVRPLAEIEDFLYGKIVEAVSEQDDSAIFTLLNEMIGLCRDTMQAEKGLAYCGTLLGLMEKMQLEGTVEYATALLNIANAYRAFGKHEEALQFFSTTQEIYEKNYEKTNFAYANLYNNWSLLCQEMGEFRQAGEMLKRALEVVDSYPEAVIQQAVSRTNLAASLLQAEQQEPQEAMQYLQEALAIFEKDGGTDFHYGAALVTMGDAKAAEQDYVEAASWYQRGLLDIQKHVGQTDNYFRVLEKYKNAVRSSNGKAKWKTNLERSREFYRQYGKAMIQEKFPEYASRIAVGVVGEGSDCFGFDDYISADHDYAPGFCMWLTEEDFSRIGESLQQAYDDLVKKHGLYGNEEKRLASRRKVCSVNHFYGELLGLSEDYELLGMEENGRVKIGAERSSQVEIGAEEKGRGENRAEARRSPDIQWETIPEYRLAHAVNGAVFRDDLGVFTGIRRRLRDYYPESVRLKKLAALLHDFSQYAQSNYPRAMARRDAVTARLCIGKAAESAMDLMYLLNRTYAPYYKWKKKGMERLEKMRTLIPLLEKAVQLPDQSAAWENQLFSSARINVQDACVACFEEIASEILREMNAQGLVQGTDPFLESYVGELMEESRRMKLVESIVELEWNQFDQVKNEGGRADCQDDWNTFSIMRKSQYLAWPEELLESYCADLAEADACGWNLITEKYARMMKSTAPVRYAELEKDLPARSAERIAIQEEIIRIQVAWMEEFAARYPKMAGNARNIHTYEDNLYNTSYETYLRGELGTYSDQTLVLYGRFVAGLMQQGKNLAYEIMTNTAELYGYADVDSAEKAL